MGRLRRPSADQLVEVELTGLRFSKPQRSHVDAQGVHDWVHTSKGGWTLFCGQTLDSLARNPPSPSRRNGPCNPRRRTAWTSRSSESKPLAYPCTPCPSVQKPVRCLARTSTHERGGWSRLFSHAATPHGRTIPAAAASNKLPCKRLARRAGSNRSQSNNQATPTHRVPAPS